MLRRYYRSLLARRCLVLVALAHMGRPIPLLPVSDYTLYCIPVVSRHVVDFNATNVAATGRDRATATAAAPGARGQTRSSTWLEARHTSIG